ncbi:MAG: terpene cyclase/mutase family protein [Clostridia bacterium]|nr:terpene cyclase/mutase family protein [Clostridia bacterium]
MKRKSISLILAFALVFTSMGSMAFAKNVYSDVFENAKASSMTYLQEKLQGFCEKSGGGLNGSFYAMDLAKAGAKPDRAYYEKLAQEVIDGNGGLEKGKTSYTNNDKGILAFTAGGYDATNICGYNLVAKLADYDAIVAQGINGPVYALMALDSGNYEIPKAPEGVTQASRENLVKAILDGRIAENGLWAYGKATDPDVDMTSMVLVALAPYVADKEVKAAVDNGIKFLSENMGETGAYSSWGSANSNSTAVAIWAICANGINPDKDKRFIDNHVSVLDGLLSFAVETGGFGYTNNKTINQAGTQQSYEALLAFEALERGDRRFYDMSDKAPLKAFKVSGLTLNASATYTGKAICPKITVKDAFGNKLTEGVDYTVKYSNNKNVGLAKASVEGKGYYSGKLSKTFKILPVKAKISYVKAKKKAFVVKTAKTKNITGYQIKYAKNSKFTKAKSKFVKSSKAITKKISASGKTKYFVKIRTYKTVGKTKYYSAWSKVYKIKTK